MKRYQPKTPLAKGKCPHCGKDLPKPMGRPPKKYLPKYAKMLTEFFEHEKFQQVWNKTTGSSHFVAHELPHFGMFCAKVGISRDLMLRWAEDYPDFHEAYEKAKASQEFTLNTGGLNGAFATGYACFLAKNILGYRDTQYVEETRNVYYNLVTEQMGRYGTEARG